MNQERGFIPVDAIRTIAILCVILLHAANDLTIQQINQWEVLRWVTVDVYQSVGRIGVPLFLMLTGALLVQPSKKDEPLIVFFKKRLARIGLPLLFWGAIFFIWIFFVEKQSVTSGVIVQGVLTGPYYHFWYFYLLFGLYLLTPIFRILIAHSSLDLIKYLLILWFIGTAIMPVTGLLTPHYLDKNVLIFTGYAGYFLLGAYLMSVRLKRSMMVLLLTLGVALTALGTYVIAATIGGVTMFFFQQYLSPTMVLASAMVFLLLITANSSPNQGALNQPDAPVSSSSNNSKIKKLVGVISLNTLPIAFIHVLILESLYKGYFGFTVNGNTLNSIVLVPLMTVIALFLSLALILPLKKVPLLSRLIG